MALNRLLSIASAALIVCITSAAAHEYFACIHAESCPLESTKSENLVFCNRAFPGDTFIQLCDQLNDKTLCPRCAFKPIMRYELDAPHVFHGAGVVLCRGSLPEAGAETEESTRVCSEYLSFEKLARFAGARKRSLHFHVASDADKAKKHSWLEVHPVTAVSTMHIVLRETSLSEPRRFDALTNDLEGESQMDQDKYLTLIDGVHGAFGGIGDADHLHPCRVEALRRSLRRAVRDVGATLFGDAFINSVRDNLARYSRQPSGNIKVGCPVPLE